MQCYHVGKVCSKKSTNLSNDLTTAEVTVNNNPKGDIGDLLHN